MPSRFRCSRTYAGLWAASLFLAGDSLGAQRRERETLPIERCATIQVVSPQKTRNRLPRFSATEILDLEIRIYFSERITGEHRFDVKVFTPDRQLYQILTVPLRAGEQAAPSTERARRKLSDQPFPIEEAIAQRASVQGKRYQMVSAVLPVAGTSIVASSLYGRWTASAFLDGNLRSCGPEARFVITQ